MFRWFARWRGVLTAVGLVVALLGATGCAATSQSTATDSEKSACATEAQKRFEATPKVDIAGLGDVPTVPLDGKKAEGKRVALLIGSMASPPNKENAEQVQAALQMAGVRSTIFDTKTQVSLQAQLTGQAVDQRYDAIYTFGINLNDITAQITAAKAAGIPVISTSGYPNEPVQYPPIDGVFANVLNDDIGSGKLQADYALWKTNCTGPYALMTADFGIFKVEAKATEDEFKDVCPFCEMKSYQINYVTDMVGNSRASALAAVSAQPGLQAILAHDVFAMYQFKAVQQAAGGKDVEFYTLGALPEGIDALKSGGVAADLQNYGNSAQAAWYNVDEIMRALTGLPADTGIQTLPLTMVTPENADQLPTYEATSEQLESKYKVLWGLE